MYSPVCISTTGWFTKASVYSIFITTWERWVGILHQTIFQLGWRKPLHRVDNNVENTYGTLWQVPCRRWYVWLYRVSQGWKRCIYVFWCNKKLGCISSPRHDRSILDYYGSWDYRQSYGMWSPYIDNYTRCFWETSWIKVPYWQRR